jgi:uncharacterized membrane protein YfcA
MSNWRDMQPNRLRLILILLLAVAAVISVVGKKLDSPFVGWLSFAVFLVAVFLYTGWRRTLAKERRARVFDREAKTDETGTRTDE